MNLFNRIVVVLLLLAGVVASITLVFTALLFPREAIANVRDLLNALDESVVFGSQILVASAAALIAIVSFLLLLLEVVPRSRKGVRLTAVTGADAELTIEAIVNRIRYEVEAVPAVRQVKSTVISRGREVDVKLNLYADPTVDIAPKTEEVSQVVRDTVENKLGIKLRHLRIFVQPEPFPKDVRARAPEQPAPAEPLDLN